MVITIDGGDGVGKTTLAYKLIEKYGFEYMRKPIDEFLRVKKANSCRAKLSKFVQAIVYDVNRSERLKVAFNSTLLLHYRNKFRGKNVIFDRGMLSCYLFNGSDKTDKTFDKYLNKGIEADLTIFLLASNEARKERMMERNANDEDLKSIKTLNLSNNQNRTVEYAMSRNMNVVIIDTTDKTADEVFKVACDVIDAYNLEQNKKNDIEKNRKQSVKKTCKSNDLGPEL